MCLEEMRGITIQDGALFYGKTKRRKSVAFDAVLRERTRQTTLDVHKLLAAGKTPHPVYSNATCPRCSLLSYCMPRNLAKASGVMSYLTRMLKEEAQP